MTNCQIPAILPKALPVEKLVFLHECGFSLNLHRVYRRLIEKGLDVELPITVNNLTCKICWEYFRCISKVDGKTYTIADLYVVRVFRPNGDVVVIHGDNSVTVWPDGVIEPNLK